MKKKKYTLEIWEHNIMWNPCVLDRGNKFYTVFSTAQPQTLFNCLMQIIILKINYPLTRFRIVSIKTAFYEN